MKLGSLKGGRDGRLVVVSRDLAWCADATHIAPTLQAALDEWEAIAPQLENLATDLAHEAIPMMRFHERQAEAPLPRAFQFAEGSAYRGHAELLRQGGGEEMPESLAGEPLIDQLASDRFLPPRAPIPFADPAEGCDFGAGVVVVAGDVRRGASRDEALAAIRLIGLVNAVSLHAPIPGERAASALSPVLVTPDELGEAWRDGKLRGVVSVDLNGRPFGRADAGEDMRFDFGTLIAQLAKTRDLGVGSIVGSGVVSNGDPAGGPSRPVDQGGRGHCCIAARRAVETVAGGSAATLFLQPGDVVRISIDDGHGHAIFGTIEQSVGG